MDRESLEVELADCRRVGQRGWDVGPRRVETTLGEIRTRGVLTICAYTQDDDDPDQRIEDRAVPWNVKSPSSRIY